MMKKMMYLGLLSVFVMASSVFAEEVTRGGGHKSDCCKELKEFKCLLEGTDHGVDKANCRLEDLLCHVNRLLELLDCDLCCDVKHIKRDVDCTKDKVNEILHCTLAHIKEQLCYLISIQTAINIRLDAFLDCGLCSKIDQILSIVIG